MIKLSLVPIVYLFVLVGCGDSNINIVKKGILAFDQTLTIGEAIDNYKYCDKKPKWESFTTDNGREIIQASCSYNIKEYREYTTNTILNLINLSENNIPKAKDKIAKYAKEINEANLNIEKEQKDIMRAEPIVNKIDELSSNVDKIISQLSEYQKHYKDNNSKLSENEFYDKLEQDEGYKKLEENFKSLSEEKRIVQEKFDKTFNGVAPHNYINITKEQIKQYKEKIQNNTSRIKDLEAYISENEDKIKNLKEQEKQLINLTREMIVQFVLTKNGGFELFALGINQNNYENFNEIQTFNQPQPLNYLEQIYNNKTLY